MVEGEAQDHQMAQRWLAIPGHDSLAYATHTQDSDLGRIQNRGECVDIIGAEIRQCKGAAAQLARCGGAAAGTLNKRVRLRGDDPAATPKEGTTARPPIGLPAIPNMPALNRRAPENEETSKRSGILSRFLGKRDE